MNQEERIKEFKDFLKCRIDILATALTEKKWDAWKWNNFNNNFTFENWLKENPTASYGSFNIKKRTSGAVTLKTISQKDFHTAYGRIKTEGSILIQEGFSYSVFNGVVYNVKQIISINRKECDTL